MNIGVIVKTDKTADELNTDWVPEPLGTKQLIYECLADILGQPIISEKFTYDKNNTLIYFTVESEDEPRAITVSYSSGKNELEILHSICSKLGAKLYDSEMCDFI